MNESFSEDAFSATQSVEKDILEESNGEVEENYDSEGSDEGELNIQSSEKLVIHKADRALFQFANWHKQGKLILDPTWQRKYVWDTKRASKLIESFLLDVPIPVVYLAKNHEDRYEVIDGVQRLTSILEFFDGKFAISGLDLMKDLNGKKFGQLESKIQEKLQDATLLTYELSAQNSQNMLFIIFERLNTGGVKLNEMEIRNSLYRGRLNNIIVKLASNPDFLHCLNQGKLDKRMTDRSLALRFLAFYEKTHIKAKDGMKRYLNDFMDIYRNPKEDKLTEFENKFKLAMKAAVSVFGDNGFRLRKNGVWSGQINQSVFQVIATSFTEYDLGALTRNADAIYEEYLDLITNDDKWVRAVSQATGSYSAIDYTFTTWNSRLKILMSTTAGNDKKRIFSKKLKSEMFDQNNTCKICGQEIKLIQDAALDHIEHYWRGGQTIPENARLVHRHCNNTRKN